MFADSRHNRTAATVRTATATWSISIVRGSRQTAAASANAAVTAAVTTMCPVLNVPGYAATIIAGPPPGVR
jgi:hypothetical protein